MGDSSRYFSGRCGPRQCPRTSVGDGTSGGGQARNFGLLNNRRFSRETGADSRPLGARLDSARAKLARAESKSNASEAALRQAKLRHDEALAQLAAASAEVAELEKVLAAPALAAPTTLEASTRQLLEALENSRVACPSSGIPEAILRPMQHLQLLLGSLGGEAVSAASCATGEARRATLPEAMAAAVKGEQSLDDVADAMFGDAEFAEDSDSDTSAAASGPECGRAVRSQPAELLNGSRTPPR